jgi:hypothetical protein
VTAHDRLQLQLAYRRARSAFWSRLTLALLESARDTDDHADELRAQLRVLRGFREMLGRPVGPSAYSAAVALD